jgi:peroxiredoxin
MKIPSLWRRAVLAASIVTMAASSPVPASAQESKALADVVGKVRQKLSAGSNSEQALAPEIESLKAFVEDKRTAAPEEAAEGQFLLAMLYVEVFGQSERGIELLDSITKDFPNTKFAQRIPSIRESVTRKQKADEARANLAVGKPFPPFETTDLDGKPLTLEQYKGKVVLVDFWATWCGPCVQELPHVKKTYSAFHDKGFDIVGISLDEDKNALTSFLKTYEMPWRQHFDGKGWNNEVAAKYGIQSIPATFLLDKSGVIIGTDLRGDTLEKAVEKALAN